MRGRNKDERERTEGRETGREGGKMRKEERRKEERVWGKKINVSLSFFSWDGCISTLITFFFFFNLGCSLTRDQTHAPCSESTVITLRLPGDSLSVHLWSGYTGTRTSGELSSSFRFEDHMRNLGLHFELSVFQSSPKFVSKPVLEKAA